MRPLARRAGLALLVVLALLVPGAAQAAPFQVTKEADTNDAACNGDCSLREAIVAANGSAGADTISVPAGHYVLTIGGSSENLAATGDLDILDDVTITGAGAGSTIVDAGGDNGVLDRVFDVNAFTATATISNLTITGGRVPNSDPVQDGGGVYALGSATLDHVVISG